MIPVIHYLFVLTVEWFSQETVHSLGRECRISNQNGIFTALFVQK